MRGEQKQGGQMQGEQMRGEQKQGEQKRGSQRPEKGDRQVSILIKPPVMYRMIGIGGMIFGCLMAFWCYSDYLQGNDTATIEIAVGFLIIPGALGLWLLFYSFRFVRLEGEDILFRDILLRSHRWHMDEIQAVKCIGGSFVIMGRQERLFRLYEYSYALERLILELEKRGAEIDIPGRPFSSSQISACHPCPDQRRFTVRFMAYSIHFYGRLEIEGRRIKLRRFLKKESYLRICDLKEVRVRENKDKRLMISVYLKNGKRLVKLAEGFDVGTDSNYVFALLRHLRETGIPVYGLEETDEGVQCMMRSGFVVKQSALSLFQREYEHILPIFREYESDFSKEGLRLIYGPLDKAGIAKQENIWKNQAWKKEGVFPDAFWLEGMVYAFYFCILIHGNVACDKKRELPLYTFFQIVSKRQGTSGEQAGGQNHVLYDDELQGYVYFLPVPEQVLRGMLNMILLMGKKKKIGVSDVMWENGES